MKLIIDIPEEEYELVRHGNKSYTTELELMYAVANGTPLPEHHGRLGDLDELYSIFKELCDDYNIDNLSFMSDMDMNFDLAPTIIEAEREDERWR